MFQRNSGRAEPAAGAQGWAQMLVPAPRAPLPSGLPRGRGAGPAGIGRCWGGGGAGSVRPPAALAGALESAAALPEVGACPLLQATLCLHRPPFPGPGRFEAEVRGAVGETSFERETCDARLAAVRRTPACGQALEGVSYPQLFLCSWSRTQSGAPPKAEPPPLAAFSAGAFGPFRRFFSEPPVQGASHACHSGHAVDQRARGPVANKGAVTAHPRRCPQSGCAT